MADSNVKALFVDQDLIACLSDLLARARKGQIRGFLFSAKLDAHRHRTGFLGQYWDNPFEAIAAGSRIQYKANQLMSARDGEPETESMPL